VDRITSAAGQNRHLPEFVGHGADIAKSYLHRLLKGAQSGRRQSLLSLSRTVSYPVSTAAGKAGYATRLARGREDFWLVSSTPFIHPDAPRMRRPANLRAHQCLVTDAVEVAKASTNLIALAPDAAQQRSPVNFANP
jgi:hypothetical protein